jgi:hypothetical protein
MKDGSEVGVPHGKKYDFSKDKSECAFHIHTPVCTPKDYLREILKLTGSSHVKDENLLPALKEKLKCDTELCVIESDTAQEALTYLKQMEIIKSFFKPKGPDTPSAWLSNFEIDDVLDQIEKKYPSFLHLNFHMRDFMNYEIPYKNLKTLNFPEEMKDGKKTFGVIINTDTHTGNGIHWFAIFGDFSREPYTIEYFNSSGEEPLPEIASWMGKTAGKWSAALKKDVIPVRVSSIMYQQDNYSCGTYSLYYIMSRLAGSELSDFVNNRTIIRDSTMHEFREYLYRK